MQYDNYLNSICIVSDILNNRVGIKHVRGYIPAICRHYAILYQALGCLQIRGPQGPGDQFPQVLSDVGGVGKWSHMWHQECEQKAGTHPLPSLVHRSTAAGLSQGALSRRNQTQDSRTSDLKAGLSCLSPGGTAMEQGDGIKHSGLWLLRRMASQLPVNGNGVRGSRVLAPPCHMYVSSPPSLGPGSSCPDLLQECQSPCCWMLVPALPLTASSSLSTSLSLSAPQFLLCIQWKQCRVIMKIEKLIQYMQST